MRTDKIETIKVVREWLDQKPLYLDTETTGLSNSDQVIELALIDHDGTPLINTLVQPTVEIDPGAEAIHGIHAEDVAGAPTFAGVLPALVRLTKDRLVLIYNADFDLRILRQSAAAHGITLPAIEARCAMTAYAAFYGEWNSYHRNYKWQAQRKAAAQLGLDLPDDLHRAAADAMLCWAIVEAMAATAIAQDSSGQKIICTICGSMMVDTTLCDRCWELERRIRSDPELARKILAILESEER